ncbi:VOC family protein [Enterovibrio sp. ZSDZ35]|uniref:VOC family protein n=1 Tax=Enterovibrio qingdaonensis TaxID=2899818 RepID=A0ABT5QJ38_9GAMM|nr:VOC family protein [Enterovibrio sp. ZSDZ35]MDD1781007.1 VOC family protein [Enterovibrio sp. ZSDZ35]
MSETIGLHHLGLSVDDLEASKSFFVEVLGWQESGYDSSYPRTAVSDGTLRLTLWQVDNRLGGAKFDRKKNVGLHHLAIQVASESKLDELYRKIADHPKCTIEFAPELLSGGPRKHMMFNEPSGLRVELIWQGV